MGDNNQIRGISFPFCIDPRSGGVAISEGNEKIQQNLKHLLLTGIGERVMVRQYGGGARQLLFENINDGLIAIAQHQLTRAILTFEPRVLPQEVSVLSHTEDGQVFIRIRYIQADKQGMQIINIPINF